MPTGITSFRAGACLLALALLASSISHANDPAPRPPCEELAPVPPFGAEEPSLEVWTNLDWRPPGCIGWGDGRYRSVIALAGRIAGTDEATLKSRIGAISRMRGLKYWSVTENAWRELIKDAHALAGPGGSRRDDFAAEDVRTGAEMYFVEEDNRSSAPVTYRVRVLQATSDRIVVEVDNTSPVESMLVTLYPPGALRTVYVFAKLDSTSWGLYLLAASTAAASPMVRLARDSSVNRARAMFGHFAGEARR